MLRPQQPVDDRQAGLGRRDACLRGADAESCRGFFGPSPDRLVPLGRGVAVERLRTLLRRARLIAGGGKPLALVRKRRRLGPHQHGRGQHQRRQSEGERRAQEA